MSYDRDNNQWCQNKILKLCDNSKCNKFIRNNLIYCKNCIYKIKKIQNWWKYLLIQNLN